MEKFNIDDIIFQIKENVSLTNESQPYIPDILEFCYSKKYLNFKGKKIKLFPMQEIILKTFYRGQQGNENVRLTENELNLLHKYNLNGVLEKYHSGNLFRELILVLGRRCVGENTEIFDPNTGLLHNIGQVYDSGITEIDTCSIDENDYSLYKTNKSNITYNGIKPVYRITLTDGRFIEATDNHPFLKVDGWINLENLKKLDRIAVPRELPFFGNNPISDDEAAIIGYITGDGCCTSSNIFFTCSKNDILKDIELRLSRIDKNVCIKKDEYTTATSKKYAYKITSRTHVVEKCDKNRVRRQKNAVAKILQKHKLLGCNAHTKFVPESILSANKSSIQNYLQCLFSCDGSLFCRFSKRDNKFIPGITYTTVSQKLAYGIHHLLVRFGIFSILRKRKVKSNFKSCGYAYQIDISSCENIDKFISQIGFIGHDKEIKKYKNNKIKKEYNNYFIESIPKEIIPFINERKKNLNIKTDRELLSNTTKRFRKNYSPNRQFLFKINQKLEDKHIKNIMNDNILWVPIKSIEYVGEQRTFDISVNYSNKHNFVANNIISHNSGKDFLTSIIALYETMKLLEMPGGSPYKYYGLDDGNPIYILTIATSSDQARILFLEIKSKLQSSEYFKNKIGAIDADRIWLQTPEDRKKNTELSGESYSSQSKGSVVIMSGHSNSDSLLGKSYYTLLFDEVASFKTTGGSSGDRLYSALGPATMTFGRDVGNDENGKPKVQIDSKIISISSPRAEDGILFKLHSGAAEEPTRLSFKLPTWKVSLLPACSEEQLRLNNKYMSTTEFQMEFGAEFSGTAGEKFIPDKYVDEAKQIGTELNLDQKIMGRPGIVYYAHLDPASTSHNYALVVLHVEERLRNKNKDGQQIKEKYKLYIVDHIKAWTPSTNNAISVNDVDNYIIDLSKRFRFAMVSYDSWNSLSSVQKLRSKGIPTKVTPFRRQYKTMIYEHLEHLLVGNYLAIPHKGQFAHLLEMELKCLKRIYGPNGFKIKPDSEAQVTTDDLTDALAGACGVAIENVFGGYPKGGLVYMPQHRSNDSSWSIGRAQYGLEQWKTLHGRLNK